MYDIGFQPCLNFSIQNLPKFEPDFNFNCNQPRLNLS